MAAAVRFAEADAWRLAQLADRGFDITGLFPVVRDAQHRVIEFDCVTINRRFCR